MASVKKKEIRREFESVGLDNLNDDIVSKCIALSTSLQVSPQRMATVWEAFSLNRRVSDLNDHCFDSFRSALIKFVDETPKDSPDNTISSRQVKRPAPPSVTPPAKRNQKNQNSAHSSGSTTTTPTPPPQQKSKLDAQRRVSLSPAPPKGVGSPSAATTGQYEQRKGAGDVLHTWNPNELDKDTRSPNSLTTPRCQVSIHGEFSANVKQRYRHMNTTVEEKARALDLLLVRLGGAIKEENGFGETSEASNDDSSPSLEAVGVPRQDVIRCIGRICNEAHEGRLNATSILLEGNRDESGGARIKLDLSHLKSKNEPYSLFPGQIVAVEGINSTGRHMVAHRIWTGAAPAPVQTTASELLKLHHGDECQGGSPLKIMSVAGPFATLDGLNYQPLWDFMHKVQAESPDVVIMTGPFVDMRQEAMQSGQTTVQNDDGSETLLPFEAFFAEQISAVLQEFFSDDGSATQFVLVPSLDDATAEWVFPQPPLADKEPSSAVQQLSKLSGAQNIVLGTLDLKAVETVGRSGKWPRRVHCVSNPCTLQINELVLGVTSADVLFHLAMTETNENLPPGSRMEHLSRHLIQQQSFYPLFPAALGTNIDHKQGAHFAMARQPDLLIAPSRLGPFARPTLDSTLVVNPGFLTKGTSGGSYATIQVHPMKRETLEDVSDGGVRLSHSITSRSRVEIKRI